MQFNNFIGLAIMVYEPRHLKEKKTKKALSNSFNFSPAREPETEPGLP